MMFLFTRFTFHQFGEPLKNAHNGENGGGLFKTCGNRMIYRRGILIDIFLKWEQTTKQEIAGASVVNHFARGILKTRGKIERRVHVSDER